MTGTGTTARPGWPTRADLQDVALLVAAGALRRSALTRAVSSATPAVRAEFRARPWDFRYPAR